MIVAKCLEQSDFGLMAAVMAFSITVYSFFDLRLHEPLIKFGTEYLEAGNKISFLSLIKLSLIASLLCSCLSFWVVKLTADYFLSGLSISNLSFDVVLLCSTVSFINFTFSSSMIAVLRILDDFKGFAIIRFISSLANIVSLFIVLSFFKLDLKIVLYQNLLVAILSFVLMLLRTKKSIFKVVESKLLLSPIVFTSSKYKEIFSFTKYTWGSQVTALPIKELDLVIAGYFCTLIEIGNYKIAKQFLSAIWLLTDPLLTVIYPELIKRKISSSNLEIKSFISKLMILFFILGVCVYVFSYFLMPYVVITFFNQRYLNSVDYFKLLSICVCIWMPLLWANPLLLSSGKARVVFIISLLVALITLLTYPLLAYHFGIIGIAFTYTLGVSLSSIFSYISCKKLKLF